MKKIIAALACSLIIALSQNTLASNSKMSNEKQSLNATELLAEKMKMVNTYQAQFKQIVQSEMGTILDESEGQFSIEKPNHFRWEINAPFEQQIIADGTHIFTYDPELEQVTLQNQSKALADSPLLLITSSSNQLSEAFNISLMDIEDSKKKELFLLEPKSAEGLFESVKILFVEDEMVELLMTDSMGQKTVVQFSGIKMNIKLDSAIFSFLIPEGVDVIDSREFVSEVESN